MYFPLSPRLVTSIFEQMYARARVVCVCVCMCAWKNVCEYVSKEAERGPHYEKRDERVQLEEVEEAGVKRDGKE